MRAGWSEARTAGVAGGRRAVSTSPAPPVTSIVTRYRPRTLASVLVLATIAIATAIPIATAVAGIEDARVVHDVAAHDGEDRADRLEILVRHVEVVLVQNHEVGELVFLDGPELILLAQEPAVASGVELQHFLARDLLARVDLHVPGVEARGGEVHVEPGIHGRDLHPVRAHPGMDAAVDDVT